MNHILKASKERLKSMVEDDYFFLYQSLNLSNSNRLTEIINNDQLITIEPVYMPSVSANPGINQNYYYMKVSPLDNPSDGEYLYINTSITFYFGEYLEGRQLYDFSPGTVDILTIDQTTVGEVSWYDRITEYALRVEARQNNKTLRTETHLIVEFYKGELHIPLPIIEDYLIRNTVEDATSPKGEEVAL